MNTNKEKAWEQCELTHIEFIEFLSELITISSQGETAIQNRVAEKLTGIGLEVKNIHYHPLDMTLRQEFVDPEMVGHARAYKCSGKISWNNRTSKPDVVCSGR